VVVVPLCPTSRDICSLGTRAIDLAAALAMSREIGEAMYHACHQYASRRNTPGPRIHRLGYNSGGMTSQPPGQPHQPIPRRAVMLPAAIACGLALILGTLGYFFVGFGMATVCTDWFPTGHHCDAMYSWLGAGAIGQLALAVAAGALLVMAAVLTERRIMVILARALIPISVAWIIITSILGRSSFKC
jgi:hypothetical protein